MRVGVTVPLGYGDTADGRAPTFQETLDFARIAESSGLDSLWVYDHLIFRFPDEPVEGLNEGWTTLTALAALVPRVELGALVMCTSFRNAGLLAKMAATLDDLSEDGLEGKLSAVANPPTSMNQARREAKAARKQASKEKHQARTAAGGA